MVPDDLNEVSWIGSQFVKGPVRGVIVSFHGLGYNGMRTGAEMDELEWSDAGGLCVYPYYGPWSWMNRSARTFIDELILQIYKQYNLAPDTPLIINGSSMGGMSALLYTRYSKHKVAACCAIYPVCDFKYHFSERADLPRTIHHAFRGYPEDMETLFKEHAPIEQVAGMPNIPYFFAHGDKDEAVNKEKHSDRMVDALRKSGCKVEYLEVPGMGHGSYATHEFHRRRIDFVKSFLKK
jgi:dipeptidyl aminopeptidase/acylaminoacyl peptidase